MPMVNKKNWSAALVLAALSGAAGASTCKTDTTQADFQAGIATSVDLTTSSGNVLLAKSSATLDQQYSTFSASSLGQVFSNTQWNAQTFTAGVSGSLARVDLNLFCYACGGGAPPPITVGIRATSGGLPSGADLATTSVTVDTSGSLKFYTANFATPANVAAGVQYAIVVRASAFYGGGTLAFTDSAIKQQNGTITGNDTYANGVLYLGKNSGASWSVDPAAPPSVDGVFRTYVGTGSSGYVSAGDLVSSLKDGAPPSGNTTNWDTIAWTNGTLPAGTSIKFQAAASNNSAGSFTFVGPDGTAATYFSSGGSLARFNGNRYLKYRAYLASNNSSSTPTLNDATVCYTNVAASADLKITNSDGVASTTAGGSVTYTITASNLGPNGVASAPVTDAFPAALTCTWTCTAAGGGTCPASGSGSINAPVTLPVNASATFKAACTVSSSASGSVTNTASIAPPAGATDPNAANNSASDTDTLVAPISITITDNANEVRIGEDVYYVIGVTNNAGPSNPTVSVTDALPAQLDPSTASWQCLASGSAACGSTSGTGGTLKDSPSLPPGSGVAYVYKATVLSADANGEVTNSVTLKVTGTGGMTATATDTDVVVIFASGFDGAVP